MKRLIALTTMVLGMAAAGLAQAGIEGSSHDFTDGLKGKSGNTGTGTTFVEDWNARKEICRVCHVPHDHSLGTKYFENGLLWNHKVSTATYTMYDANWSPSLTGTQAAQPVGTAKLCLGCHDGTVAIDTFDRYTTAAVFFDGTSYSAGYKVPGFPDGSNLDLRGTHPISIEFPTGQVGTQFNDPATATWIGGATVASTLENGKMNCATCHDVHSSNVAAGSHILRQAQTLSQGGTPSGLCLTCHKK